MKLRATRTDETALLVSRWRIIVLRVRKRINFDCWVKYFNNVFSQLLINNILLDYNDVRSSWRLPNFSLSPAMCNLENYWRNYRMFWCMMCCFRLDNKFVSKCYFYFRSLCVFFPSFFPSSVTRGGSSVII